VKYSDSKVRSIEYQRDGYSSGIYNNINISARARARQLYRIVTCANCAALSSKLAVIELSISKGRQETFLRFVVLPISILFLLLHPM